MFFKIPTIKKILLFHPLEQFAILLFVGFIGDKDE